MKYLITGDSWGCGEWQLQVDQKRTGKRTAHAGLQKYLEADFHKVGNISQPGASLDRIIHDLNNHVVFRRPKYDAVFIFVTDAFRDIRPEELWRKRATYEYYLDLYQSRLQEFVKKLDKFPIDLGPIYLLGGLSKVSTDFIKSKRVKIAIPSILELIVPGSRQHDVVFQKHFPDISKHNTNKEAFRKICEQDEILQNYFTHEALYPDGAHPNRESHRIIYQYLKENKFIP